MLCEDLEHATEQLNTLTEASRKHSGLLQSAQEELTRKDALILELQHEVRCSGAWLRVGRAVGEAGLHGGWAHEVPALANSPHSEKQASRVRRWAFNRLRLCVQTCMAVLLPTLNPWHMPASSDYCGQRLWLTSILFLAIMVLYFVIFLKWPCDYLWSLKGKFLLKWK